MLERGRVAERWLSERWDSLAFQFTNSMLRLPGNAYSGDAPDSFMSREGIARFFTDYAVRLLLRFAAELRLRRCARRIRDDLLCRRDNK